MTISSETSKSGPYLGNGSTKIFDYQFKIVDETHLTVIKRDTSDVESTLILNTDYTVADVGQSSGGQITLDVAPAVGETITILRNVPFTQETDLENQGAYYAETVEAAFDLMVMRDQQLQEQIDRAVRIPASADPSALDSLVEDIIRLGVSADEIDTVANIAGDVSTVASNIANVTTVANNIAGVNTVATNVTSVNTVAAIAGNVNTVAGDSDEINALAPVSGGINTLAPISADITTVAGVSSDISTVAANVADVTNFADVYLGGKASDPALRNDGSALQEGDLYFNTTVSQLRIYDGASWRSVTDQALNIVTKSFVGDGVETEFTLDVAPGTVNNILVELGGVIQKPTTDYTVAGSTLSFTSAPGNGVDIGTWTLATTATLNVPADGTTVWPVDSIASLKALPTSLRAAYLTENGRAGNFVFTSGDLSAMVTADTLEGIYVAPASDPTGASGAWVRQGGWAVEGADARWWGLVADYDRTTGTGTDNHAALIAALAVVPHVRLPGGYSRISDKVTVPTNKKLTGLGRTISYLAVDNLFQTFNMLATGVLELGTGEPGATILDLGIYFQQDRTNGVRANVIHYPPAIDATDTPRGIIDRVRWENAWDGIKATGNSGGLWIGDVEDGALNVGLDVDGSLDFFHIGTWHHWPFGYVGTSLYTGVHNDGNTYAMKVGRVDNIDIGSITSFNAKVQFAGPGHTTVAGPTQIARQVSRLALDGDYAQLVMMGGTVQVGDYYTTASAAPPFDKLVSTGGLLIVSNYHDYMAGAARAVYVNGGIVEINGGDAIHLSVGEGAFAEVASGRLALRNMLLNLPAAPRTAPFIKQSGAGVLIVKNSEATYAGANGPLIEIGQDNAENDISGNSFGSWGLTLPATFQLGRYGPNRCNRRTFTPTFEFANDNDLVPTFIANLGQYWIDSAGIHFEIRSVFTCNEYSTGSGALYIGGFPVNDIKNLDIAAMTLGSWGKITLTAGYTDLSVAASLTHDKLVLRQCGSGMDPTTITATNIPPGTTNVEICISGVLPTR